MRKTSVIGATLVAAAMLCAAPISLQLSQDKGLSLSVDKAGAVVGRPLTPGSVAGVHRRHHRRHGYYNHGHHYNYTTMAHYYNHRSYYNHHYRYW